MLSPSDLPQLRLTKHEALGNDFLVALDEAGGPWPALGPTDARALCHRRHGVGADGLIRGEAGHGTADITMHLWNADGSRAEISGNGIRCLAQALMVHRRSTAPVLVATDAGERCVRWEAGPDHLRTGRWSVGMGRPDRHDPTAGTVEVLRRAGLRGRNAAVDVGNPHVVVEVDDPAAVDVARWGAEVEASVPGGANVEFVALTRDGVDLRVWERGAGLTEACGSGACAAAVAARDWGTPTPTVEVRMPGGAVAVTVGADGGVELAGASTLVAGVEVWRA